MPTTPRSTTGSRKGLLARTGTFEARIESASGIPSFEEVPLEYKRRMMKNIASILKRSHLQTVVKELKKGTVTEEETYTPEYARRKTGGNVNVRALKGLISGTKTYTPSGPVDFIRSGQLYNSLVTDVRIKGNEVRSRIVVGPNARRGDKIGNRELVNILDREKNLREHATEAVQKNEDTLITGTIKKAIAKANLGG